MLIAGWRHKEDGLNWLDVTALAVGGAGVVLLAGSLAWPALIPMTAAIAVAVATDFTAFTPTMANAVAGNEPPGPFLVFAAGAVCALSADFASPPGTVYPAYEVVACVTAAGLAWAGRRRMSRDEVADWRIYSEPVPGITESATVARWTPRRPAYPPPEPWTYPSGPLV